MQLGQGHGTEVCSNGQTAVDSKPKLMIANDVTNDTGDRDCLSPLALQAKAILGGTFDAVAEVGYYHGEEVTTCLAAGLPPSIARPVPSATPKLGPFSKEDCTYEGATDPSQCPAGAPLAPERQNR